MRKYVLLSLALLAVLTGCGQQTAQPKGISQYPGNSPTTSSGSTLSSSFAYPSHIGESTNADVQSQHKTGPIKTHPHLSIDPINAAVSESHSSVANPPYYKTSRHEAPPHVFVPIITYHEGNTLPGDPYGMAPGQFSTEMQWLFDHGYHTITLKQLQAALYQGKELPEKSVVITIDDGYESTYTKFYPVLKSYHFTGTLFMVSGIANHPNHLTTTQLQEMDASGVIDVEAHTVHHPHLSNSPNAGYEIRQSKTDLEKIVGHPILYFAYPYGDYNFETVEQVQAAGYQMAFTTNRGWASVDDGLFTVKRLGIESGLSISQFAQIVSRQS